VDAAETLALAVAQVQVVGDLPTPDVLRAAGERVRSAIVAAADRGARIVQFPEGMLTNPAKRLISGSSPHLGDADWTRADWRALREELERIADACRARSICAVVGAPHQLSDGHRPHNSLYVFSSDGELVTRYDKRRLSTNETSYLYTPGTDAVVFEVDGFRFGMVICLETLFPELFIDYAAMDVDCVLISSAADPNFGRLASAHAVMNAITVSVAFASGAPGDSHRSGICTALGWIARCENAGPGLAVGGVPKLPSEVSFHRRARNGLYDPWLAPKDPRSLDRRTL